MDFASALERSAAIRSKVSAMERTLAANPQDKGLRITLLSTKRLAERAEAHLVDAAGVAQIDMCRYRIVKPGLAEYPAIHLANSIVAYQNLFTAIYDYIKTGPKKHARYTKETKERALLNLAYTYPGSLGILLTIGDERNLFGEGELDNAIKSLQRITCISSDDDVQRIAEEMGLNVVNKVYHWADENWKSGLSLDLQWARSDKIVSGGFVSIEDFFKLSTLINGQIEEQPKTIHITGTLGSYSILRDTFAIITYHGDIYSGKLSDKFNRNEEYLIPSEYSAEILVNTITKYASEKEEITYTLLNLKEKSA